MDLEIASTTNAMVAGGTPIAALVDETVLEEAVLAEVVVMVVVPVDAAAAPRARDGAEEIGAEAAATLTAAPPRARDADGAKAVGA